MASRPAPPVLRAGDHLGLRPTRGRTWELDHDGTAVASVRIAEGEPVVLTFFEGTALRLDPVEDRWILLGCADAWDPVVWLRRSAWRRRAVVALPGEDAWLSLTSGIVRSPRLLAADGTVIASFQAIARRAGREQSHATLAADAFGPRSWAVVVSTMAVLLNELGFAPSAPRAGHEAAWDERGSFWAGPIGGGDGGGGGSDGGGGGGGS